MKRKIAAAFCLAIVAGVAMPLTSQADQPISPAYRQAVSDAYAVIIDTSPSDYGPAQEATAILRRYTGDTQPEILYALGLTPPDYDTARADLKALLAALDNPATTSDPQDASAKLHRILSESRYDALHRPPSALDRFGQWVQDRIRDLLRALFGGNGSGGAIPNWALYLAGVVIIAAVAVIVFRSAGGRLGGDLEGLPPGAPRPPADYFAEADELAAKGDYARAIRALCAGVAGTLAGEKTWEGSPLTVREIFSKSSDPGALRPLLAPFEASVYGGREVDAAAYEKAAQVAAPFRAPLEAAA